MDKQPDVAAGLAFGVFHHPDQPGIGIGKEMRQGGERQTGRRIFGQRRQIIGPQPDR